MVRVLVAVSLSVSLSGCALPYYWQAVGGQLGIMRQRVPIEAVLEDPEYDDDVRAHLALVKRLRDFSGTRLELPADGSYETYVDLGRGYVVWNVIATQEFSIEPERWCFPVAGCVAYRGYFDRADAERFEAKLKAQGLDTYSGGSAAYSTLGYFSDPVLSTMIRGSDAELAGVLFHELAHQRLYIKDDSELSEAFATAVEEHGVELWLSEHGDNYALEAYLARRARRQEFGALIADQRQSLQALYARELPAAELRAAKVESFASLRAQYDRLKVTWGGVSEFDGWFSADLNNASLVAISTYRRWLPGLRWRLAQVGVPAFYAEVEALLELEDDARVERLEEWNLRSTTGAVAQAG